jgi:hypothetical protein
MSRTEIEQLSKIPSQWYRDHHLSDTKVHEINNEHRDSGDSRDEHLVAPSDVEQVVANAQQDNGLQRKDSGQVRRELNER